jgi:hypothetical protein
VYVDGYSDLDVTTNKCHVPVPPCHRVDASSSPSYYLLVSLLSFACGESDEVVYAPDGAVLLLPSPTLLYPSSSLFPALLLKLYRGSRAGLRMRRFVNWWRRKCARRSCLRNSEGTVRYARYLPVKMESSYVLVVSLENTAFTLQVALTRFATAVWGASTITTRSLHIHLHWRE